MTPRVDYGALLAFVGILLVPVVPRGDAVGAQDGVSITYLANEGVMLSSGTRKVLIDALFQRYGTGFALPADSTRAALEHARPPFDSVDLVLVTHRHGDHFHPASVAAHMRANPGAVLLTSRQVIDSLRGRPDGDSLAAARTLSHTIAAGTRRRVVVNGIPVELLGLSHIGRRHRRVQHLGYIVELGGRRVLHVGDAEVSEAAFAPLRLDTARIDVALLPHWDVIGREGRRVIERWIRPRQVVAFHVGEGQERTVARAVRAAFPAAVTLVRSLETHRW
jgi:L-ascorbate metabolism protein UlaG (beta-lactamase superfamily)